MFWCTISHRFFHPKCIIQTDIGVVFKEKNRGSLEENRRNAPWSKGRHHGHAHSKGFWILGPIKQSRMVLLGQVPSCLRLLISIRCVCPPWSCSPFSRKIMVFMHLHTHTHTHTHRLTHVNTATHIKKLIILWKIDSQRQHSQFSSKSAREILS